MNPVIMGKGLRMPQFEIVKIAASDCQESFQIGVFHYVYLYVYISCQTLQCESVGLNKQFDKSKMDK